MKSRRLLRALVAWILGIFSPLSVTAAPLSGTKSVGPTGDYTSLTAAIADVQAGGNGLGGALVLELQATYLGTVETFPLTLSALTGASAANTLTIRPASGATALSISSADATAATVDLNGAQFVAIDGRPGGVGSNVESGGGAASQLTIANTSTSGVALRFSNEASSNTLRYTTLRGVNASATRGVVVFTLTTGANGNDNNTIDHCDIADGTSTPANGIYSDANNPTPRHNSANVVSNCNIFNFYGATAVDSAGIRLESANTDWIIAGNSFYQTASRPAVSGSVRPICINTYTGSNFKVTDNVIGGSAPNAGGAAWTTTGTTAEYGFTGIRLNVGTTTPSNVQGNTIANMVWTGSGTNTPAPNLWCGIYVQAGSVNIGTLTGNTIGSGTGTSSVSITTSKNGGTSVGIGAAGDGTRVIANNTIGSMTVRGSADSISASLTGISVVGGANAISNNTVGSNSTAHSLNAATSSTSATGQAVTGILSTATGAVSITGNMVANLNNDYAGIAQSGQIRGIVTYNGVQTITGNTVRNLSTTSRNTDPYQSQSVYGIIINSSEPGQTMSQNTVHSLANTAPSQAVAMTGIYYAGLASGTNVISRNLVHSLALSSTSATSEVNGMEFSTGTFTARNNMVRLGLKADGSSTAGASLIYGISDNYSDSGRNYYHNSIYLGGTQTSGGTLTVAFQGGSNANARTFQNNIFVNARSNSGGAGKHYAVQYGGTIVNPPGLTAGGNIFLASGIGGVLGLYDSIDRTTLAAWQAATGQDATSAVADPLFLAPNGTATTVDLHLQPNNPSEGGGISLTDAKTGGPAIAADDFDGQTRSTLTPVDIGADAGSFTSTGDIFAPAISYPLIINRSSANRALTAWATITDNSASIASGATAPRLYYKKSSDADVFAVANDATGNGWKYVTATGSGPYSFTLDYSLINGGSVTAGNIIQYFVVAQDAADRLGSGPLGATASTNPPVRNVSGHGAVNSFSILAALSGTKTVGSGGDYPSLKGSAGLFAAINGGILTGDLVVNITSNLTESGSLTLGQWQEEGAGNYKLTIQPGSATMRTISGSSTAGLITFSGADRVTFDGRYGGSGRYLTFRNTNTGTSNSTLLFINDASNNSIRNCIVEGASSITPSNGGVILFSTGTVTGNDNNLIIGCQVRDLSSTVGVPTVLIGSTGGSASVANSDNTVSNNELFNFASVGININATGNDSWTVSGNNIYEVTAGAYVIYGINMRGGGNNIITGNSIHDLLTTNVSSRGIYFTGTGTTTIARNRITVLNANAATTTIYGIFATGGASSTLHLLDNQITLSPAASSSATLYGIHDAGSSGSVVNSFYNSVVLGGTESGMASSWASYRNVASTHTARNNLFLNLRTGGTGSHFAAGSEITGGSYTASHNVYAGTGATAANFMDFSSTSGTAAPISFAMWQSATGDTNSQAGLAGSGSFTSAMFVNAATGDLHLVPGGNPLVNNTGTPVAGITMDFDGDTRNATTPSIGADEFSGTAANLADSDGDGVVNLLEYAFGTDPLDLAKGVAPLAYTGTFAVGGTIAALGQPLVVTEYNSGTSETRLLFVRRKDFATAGITYTVRLSADLVSWTDLSGTPSVLADDGTYEIVSYILPTLAGGETGRFARVAITGTGP